MSDLVDIRIDEAKFKAVLDGLAAGCSDLTPVMRKISQTLATATDLNFIDEGNPAWEPLSETTKFLRLGGKKAFDKKGRLKKSAERKKEKGFRILQKSGSLATSVSTRYDATSLSIGTNKVYGRIHQKGGKAGRGLKVTIPARPFLPVTADGRLHPDAEQEVMETLYRHLEQIAGK